LNAVCGTTVQGLGPRVLALWLRVFLTEAFALGSRLVSFNLRHLPTLKEAAFGGYY